MEGCTDCISLCRHCRGCGCGPEAWDTAHTDREPPDHLPLLAPVPLIADGPLQRGVPLCAYTLLQLSWSEPSHKASRSFGFTIEVVWA